VAPTSCFGSGPDNDPPGSPAAWGLNSDRGTSPVFHVKALLGLDANPAALDRRQLVVPVAFGQFHACRESHVSGEDLTGKPGAGGNPAIARSAPALVDVEASVLDDLVPARDEAAPYDSTLVCIAVGHRIVLKPAGS
jgi:hypothetical protein